MTPPSFPPESPSPDPGAAAGSRESAKARLRMLPLQVKPHGDRAEVVRFKVDEGLG